MLSGNGWCRECGSLLLGVVWQEPRQLINQLCKRKLSVTRWQTSTRAHNVIYALGQRLIPSSPPGSIKNLQIRHSVHRMFRYRSNALSLRAEAAGPWAKRRRRLSLQSQIRVSVNTMGWLELISQRQYCTPVHAFLICGVSTTIQKPVGSDQRSHRSCCSSYRFQWCCKAASVTQNY